MDRQTESQLERRADSFGLDEADDAVADFEFRMQELFESIMAGLSEESLRAIAERAGVTRSRLESFLRGDNLVNMEAFVRYLTIAGYRPILNAVRHAADVPDLSRAMFDSSATRVDFYRQRVVTNRGVEELAWTREADFDEPHSALEDMQHEVTLLPERRAARQRDYVESSDDVWEAQAEWIEDDIVIGN